MNFLKAIFEFLGSLFGLLNKKEDRKNKEFEARQTEEFKKVETKKAEVARVDENEKLVDIASNSRSTKEQKEAALEEIRRRVAK